MALIIRGIIGATVGAIIILVPFNKDSIVMDKSEFQLWAVLICTLYAIVFIIAPTLFQYVRKLSQHFKGNWIMIVVILIVVMGLFSLEFFVGSIYEPATYQEGEAKQLLEFGIIIKIILLVAGVEILIGLPVVIGILLTLSAVKDKMKEIRGDQGNRNILWYIEHRDMLQKLLWIAGSVLGISILTTGALSKFISSFGIDYPMYLVLAYGISFTSILAILYIPAYFSLNKLGFHLRDILFPLPEPNSDSWMEITSKRKSLEELLELRTSIGQNVLSDIPIMAPLLGGLISTLLK
jgi:hypothetical protein